MLRTTIIIASIVALGLLLVSVFLPQKSKKEQVNELMTVVKKGSFDILVNATGELNAKRSVKIRGPQGMRSAGIFETTITDLVAEGTMVKEGDYVATLDRTELANKMNTLTTEIEKIQTQLEQAKIDTAIELRGIRDQLINLEFNKREKLLSAEQSKYEAESIIRQTQLDLERTERDYQQLLKTYDLKQQQSDAKIREINTLLRQNQLQMNVYTGIADGFRIVAPESGMVIYSRTWNGKKEPGSRISAWDPVVAELPDLSDMISKSYVNEVDISKVKKGQNVKIKVDAFPDQSYSGRVIKVANIGEQLRGYDAKVFEVIIQLLEVDSLQRPAMTTSNEIVTNVFEDVLFLPLEAIYTDSLSYVFKEEKGKIVRQEVVLGMSNDEEIIIEHGLEEGFEIYLNRPADFENLPFVPIDEKIKKEIAAKMEEEARAREALANEQLKSLQNVTVPTSNSGGSDMIIIME